MKVLRRFAGAGLGQQTKERAGHLDLPCCRPDL